VAPKLTAPAVVEKLLQLYATVALAIALVGEIAAINILVITVAVSEETPWSLTELPLKTMRKLVSIWTNRE